MSLYFLTNHIGKNNSVIPSYSLDAPNASSSLNEASQLAFNIFNNNKNNFKLTKDQQNYASKQIINNDEYLHSLLIKKKENITSLIHNKYITINKLIYPTYLIFDIITNLDIYYAQLTSNKSFYIPQLNLVLNIPSSQSYTSNYVLFPFNFKQIVISKQERFVYVKDYYDNYFRLNDIPISNTLFNDITNINFLSINNTNKFPISNNNLIPKPIYVGERIIG